MSHVPFNDREIERVLAGQQPYARPELAEVAYFVARLRTLVDFERPPPIGPELRAQLEAAEAAQLRRAKGRRLASVAPSGDGDPERQHDLQLVRLEERREAKVARLGRRWRLVGAAAAVVTIGGVVAVGLQAGSSPPPVETEPVVEQPADQPTTTPGDDETQTDGTEVPAASPGEGSTRPSNVPADPPASQVETSTPTTTEPVTTTQPPASNDLPAWLADDWPAECAHNDWWCFCRHYDGGRYRQYCDPDGSPQGPNP